MSIGVAVLPDHAGTVEDLVRASDTALYQDLRETNRALERLLEELGKEPGKLNVQVKMF